MHDLSTTLLFLLAGIGAITIIDSAGSIASRKLKFVYSSLTFISIALYLTVSILLYKNTGETYTTLFVVLLMGIYDGTVGWHLSKKLKAYYGKYTALAEKTTDQKALLTSFIFSFICGVIGVLLAG